MQESALIDNIAANVEGWIEAGGGGYVFRSDEQFIQDVEARLVPGFEAADVALLRDGAESVGYSAPGSAQ